MVTRRSHARTLKTLFFHVLLIFGLLTGGHRAFCGDRPFNNAANWGGTGLMEIPNARVLEDGFIRFGFAQALPYRWYMGGMGVFPGLEVSGRYTEITNIPAAHTISKSGEPLTNSGCIIYLRNLQH